MDTTYLVAGLLLHLPPSTTTTAVVLAALPTGTGTFMFAELYRREALLTGRVVLVSTVLSVITLAVYLSAP